jgi:hypothetical protein
MTDIRDAHPHTDGFESRPGDLPFGISPDDVPYADFDEEHDLRDNGWGFDDDEIPCAPLALDQVQEASLTQAIQAGLREHGCDNTPRAAEAWARREKVRWGWLRNALEERGGFCDCEVLLNVLEPPD